MIFFFATAGAAFVFGFGVNQLRSNPLPLIYQSKEERIQQAVGRIAKEQKSTLAGPLQGESSLDFLSLKEFSALVDAEEGLVIDARPEVFYQLGHVPGAINLPREHFESAYQRFESRLEDAKLQVLIIYCADSSCEDSELVGNSLLELGFPRVLIFKGGWSEWSAAGGAEERGL